MIRRVEGVAGVQVFVALPVAVVLVVVILECEGELTIDGVEWIVGLHWHLIYHVVVIVVDLFRVLLRWRGNGLDGIEQLAC